MINNRNSTNFGRYKSTGFTLIEVMVASVILFASIAVVSVVYRGAFISSEKANTHIKVSGMLPSILATIREDIRQQGNSTSIELQHQSTAWQIKYRWQASLLKQKAAQPIFDPDLGEMTSPPQKFKLWAVQLTLEYGNLTQNYQFNELSWNDK